MQTLALVGAGEVNDHRRAAADGAAGTGVKIIRCRRIADVQIKMRVRVNKAREQELSRHIDHIRLRAGNLRRNLFNFLAVNQHVADLRSAAGYHRAALE